MQELEMIELVGSVGRKVMRRFKAVAASAGLSATEGQCLWQIRLRGACKASDLADHQGLSPSTITGVLDRLEAGGWIVRETDPADRRAVTIRGTAELADFLKGAKRTVVKDLERTFKDLPEGLMERLCADLALVLAAIETEEKREQ